MQVETVRRAAPNELAVIIFERMDTALLLLLLLIESAAASVRIFSGAKAKQKSL